MQCFLVSLIHTPQCLFGSYSAGQMKQVTEIKPSTSLQAKDINLYTHIHVQFLYCTGLNFQGWGDPGGAKIQGGEGRGNAYRGGGGNYSILFP